MTMSYVPCHSHSLAPRKHVSTKGRESRVHREQEGTGANAQDGAFHLAALARKAC